MGEMSKRPEKIKKDLAAWGTGVRIDIGCGEFVPPTPEYMLNGVRSADVCRDALALIQQLEAQNAELVRKTEQLQRERDAAVADLNCNWKCAICKRYTEPIDKCPHYGGCGLCYSNFEWRGVQEKEGENDV